MTTATDHDILNSLLTSDDEASRTILLDFVCERLPGADQAAFKAELEAGRVNMQRVVAFLRDRPTWSSRVSPATLSTIRMRVERVNKAIRRRKNATEWVVVAGPEIRTVINPNDPPERQMVRVRHDVEVYGPPFPQVKPGYRLIGIISSAYEKGDVRDADGQLLRVVPGGENREAEMTAMLGEKHRCTHCNSARKRNHIFLAECPDGSIARFGANCAESYIPDRQAVEAMLRFLDAARGRGGLEGEQHGGCKIGWSPCALVRLVLRVIARFSRYVNRRDARTTGPESGWATLRHCIESLWPWWGWHYSPARRTDPGDLASVEAHFAEIDQVTDDWRERARLMTVSGQHWLEGQRSQQWLDVDAWVAQKQDGSTFWANAQSALNAQCVTWKTVRLIVSAVGQYWQDNLAPKPLTLPQVAVDAFKDNAGQPMGYRVFRRLTGLEDAKISELLSHRLIVASGEVGTHASSHIISLPGSTPAAPAQPEPQQQPAQQDRQSQLRRDLRPRTRMRNLGRARVVYFDQREGEYGSYGSFIVRLIDSNESVIFNRSGRFDIERNQVINITAATFQRYESSTRTVRGRRYTNHDYHFNRVQFTVED